MVFWDYLYLSLGEFGEMQFIVLVYVDVATLILPTAVVIEYAVSREQRNKFTEKFFTILYM